MISRAFEIVFSNFFSHPVIAVIAIALGLITCIWIIQDGELIITGLLFGILSIVFYYIAGLLMITLLLIAKEVLSITFVILILLIILIII